MVGTSSVSRRPERCATSTLDVASPPMSFAASLAALGELAHLGGHDGEAAAMLAGTRRFDGGVEREEVRLVGDLLDDGDLLRDLRHRLDGLLDGLRALVGVAPCP